MSTKAQGTNQIKSQRRELLNWIKSQPDLEHIRKLANQTKVQYNKNEKNLSKRIRVFNRAKYKTKKSLLKSVFEIFWVPGRKLRGTAYSNKNLDQQLNQTASIMSLSTIWDFICTSPVIYYFAKGSGLLVLPMSALYAILLLVMSNKAGEFAMNRSKESNRTASFLLIVFFTLSFIKTLMSGVGIDLVSRSGEIKNLTAKEFVNSKSITFNKSKKAYGELLESVSNECNRLALEQSKLDPTKGGQRRLYRELQEKMYKKPLDLPSTNPKILIERFATELGPCTQKDVINSIIGNKDFTYDIALNAKFDLRDSLSPMSYLYVFNRNQYYNLFNGSPLIGSESNLEKYKDKFENSTINFRTECLDSEKNCNGKVRWTDPGNAINQASRQFYKKISTRDFQSLGFSFVGFLISILLSITAVVLLYTSSTDMKVRASRSSYVLALRNKIFTDLNSDDDDGDGDGDGDDNDDIEEIKKEADL